MSKSPRAVQATGKMLHIQGVWKRSLQRIKESFNFKLNASFHLSDLYPVSIA